MTFGQLMLPVLILVGIPILFLYFRNMFRAIKDVRAQSYTVKLVIRVVGIFVFPVGIIMGLV